MQNPDNDTGLKMLNEDASFASPRNDWARSETTNLQFINAKN